MINRQELMYLLSFLKLANFRNAPRYDYDMLALEGRGLVWWDQEAHGRGGAWMMTPVGEAKLEAVLACFESGA